MATPPKKTLDSVPAGDRAEWERYIGEFNNRVAAREQQKTQLQAQKGTASEHLKQVTAGLTEARTDSQQANLAVSKALTEVNAAKNALKTAKGDARPAAEARLEVGQTKLAEAKQHQTDANKHLKDETAEQKKVQVELQGINKSLTEVSKPVSPPRQSGVPEESSKKVAGVAAVGEVLQPGGPVKLDANMPTSINNGYDVKLNFNAIAAWEGNYSKAYIPWWPNAIKQADGSYQPEIQDYKGTDRIVSRLGNGQRNMSGPTIGPGVDLGAQGKDGYFKSLDAANKLLQGPDGKPLLDDAAVVALKGKLEPYFGLKGGEACQFLRSHPLELNGKELSVMTIAAHDGAIKVAKAGYAAAAKGVPHAPAFKDLPEAAQTVMISRAYQTGQSYSGLSKAFAEQDYAKAQTILSQGGDKRMIREGQFLKESLAAQPPTPSLKSEKALTLQNVDDARITGTLSAPAAEGSILKVAISNAQGFTGVYKDQVAIPASHGEVSIPLEKGQKDFSLTLMYADGSKAEQNLNLTARYVSADRRESAPSNSIAIDNSNKVAEAGKQYEGQNIRPNQPDDSPTPV